VVNKHNQIFRYDGKRFRKTATGKAVDVSIGANGAVMIVGTDRKPYFWDGSVWKQLRGNHLANITVDKNGAPWATTTANVVFAFPKAAGAKAAKVSKSSPDRLKGTFLLKVKTSGKCLDKTASNNNGVRSHQWPCELKNGNQQFIAEYLEKDDWFRIKNIKSKRCIDVKGASKKRRAGIIQWDCHRNGNQKWKLVPRGDGWNSLVVQHSGKCLDLRDGKKNNGAQFIQYDCQPKNSNQLYQVIGVQ
jgi:hypothetical protein